MDRTCRLACLPSPASLRLLDKRQSSALSGSPTAWVGWHWSKQLTTGGRLSYSVKHENESKWKVLAKGRHQDSPRLS
eukprot:361935-Chlamydomonas_euryale.AAC.16